MLMTRSDSPAGALDLAHLGAQTFGDRGLERELLELFEQQCRRLLPAIEGRSPIMARGEAAHTLKGAALAVGGAQVAAIAAAIEDASERGSDEDRLMRLARDLDRAIEEVVAAIALRRREAA
jgi:HPt (histidine-containing phosphotransfer) domain-containing protein